jgi:hypothetical protein
MRGIRANSGAAEMEGETEKTLEMSMCHFLIFVLFD